MRARGAVDHHVGPGPTQVERRAVARRARRPILRGLRIPAATVVCMVGEGMSVDGILEDYPDPEAADIREALFYAAEAVRERELPLRLGA